MSVPIHIEEKIERQTLDKKTQGFLQPDPCGQSFPRAGLRLDQNPVLLEVIL